MELRGCYASPALERQTQNKLLATYYPTSDFGDNRSSCAIWTASDYSSARVDLLANEVTSAIKQQLSLVPRTMPLLIQVKPVVRNRLIAGLPKQKN